MAQENASPSRSMPSIHDGAGALRRSSLGQISIDRTPQSPAPPIFTTMWEQGGNDGKGEDLLRPAAETGNRQQDVYKITNTNLSTVIDTHLLIIVRGLSSQFRLENASGTTSAGDPYIRVFLPDGVLQVGQGITQTLVFARQPPGPPPATGPVPVILNLMSGQGNP